MIIGTAGHIDHGKTSLVRALTGVDTDRLKEEKARGISIDLGFAYLPAPTGESLGFVDVPGHEKFIHNMLAGATGIDFVLLTVSANDGIMPQTREHVAIVNLLGIKRGIVALTKADLASPLRQEQVRSDVRQLLSDTALADAEVVPVSTVTGDGIETLRARLFEASQAVEMRTSAERFRLAVDRSFTLRGIGTIVTGTVISGAVMTEGQVTVSPSGFSARVRSIHAHNRPAERGVAGQRCALNLVGEGIGADAIARGDMVVESSLHAPAGRIDVLLRLLSTERKPITQWMPARLHHAAAEVDARIVLLGDAPIGPGEEGLVQLVLDSPIAAAAGDRFVLRDTTAQRTIGGGKFLDIRAPARKRRTAERQAQLQAHAYDDPGRAVMALIDTSPHFIDLMAFSRDRALSVQQINSIADRLGFVKLTAGSGVYALSASIWREFKLSLLAALKAFHANHPDLPGISLDQLRFQLRPRLPAPAFLSSLNELVRSKEVVVNGARVCLACHEAALTPSDARTWSRMVPLLTGGERFHPPRIRDIATTLGLREAELRRLLKLLARNGDVDEIVEDRYFLHAAVIELVQLIVDLAGSTPDGKITAAQYRDCVGIGRNGIIHILEFFDRHGLTMRRGDLRTINKSRVDQFLASSRADKENESSGGESSPVGRPDFKSGGDREPVLGGFDSLSLPPR